MYQVNLFLRSILFTKQVFKFEHNTVFERVPQIKVMNTASLACVVGLYPPQH